ncbi:MAG: hypothetical protein WBI57_16950, partial [Desulfobacterales bacterium]
LILFSESAGRFIVTIDPKNREVFEKIFSGLACSCIGVVTDPPEFVIQGIDDRRIMKVSVQDLKAAWKKPFGELI